MRDQNSLIVGGQILLYGYVGDQWDGFTAAEVVRALASFAGEPVTVRINSMGGNAYEAAAIRAALAAHGGAVTAVIEGVALSAASLICCAAARVEVAADASVMIHDPQMMIGGDAAALAAGSAELDALAETFAAIYAVRLGVEASEARDLMRAETWWRGAEAVAAGFADAVTVEAPPAAVMAAAEAAPLMIGGGAMPPRMVSAAIAAGWKEGGRIGRPDTLKGNEMTKPNPAPAPAPAPEMVAPAPAPAPAPAAPAALLIASADLVAMVAGAVSDARKRDAEIRSQCAALQISEAATAVMIASNVTMDGVAAAVTAAWMAEGGPRSAAFRTPASVRGAGLDAGDTMRTGIAAAMDARLTGADVADGPGADWIGMSVPEMAAAFVGHRGSLRTYSQRAEVLMSAMHTGSDFVGITSGAINRRLAEVYGVAEVTYRAIAEAVQFRDFRAHEQISVGDLPDLLPVASSGDIKSGTVGDSVETAHLIAYARKFAIGREVFINDDLGALARLIGNYGNRVAEFEERTFWALALSAKMKDGVAVWHADRGNLGSVALSGDALSAGRAAIRKTPGPDGKPRNARPAFLVVGPDYETAAEKLVSPVAAVVTDGVNPFAGRLASLVSGEIPEGEFLLFASPMLAPAFCYGFLEGAGAPRIRVETPFGSSGMGVSIEHDFGFGARAATTYRSAV
jgi:ATP-dependent protease ClpP protease subunit